MADNTQLSNEINNMTDLLAAAYYTYNTYISNLENLYGRMMSGRITKEEIAQDKAKINEIFTRLDQYNKHFGANVNRFNKQVAPQLLALTGSQVKAKELVCDFVKLADAFDRAGQNGLADQIDDFLAKSAQPHDLIFMLTGAEQNVKTINNMAKLASFSDEIGAHTLASELDKMAEEMFESIQPPNKGSLSTRYCPDHNGVQAVRISERVYQCPIDGKIYNYETGYVNYKGQKVPGGSVAAQTPTTSDFGGIPMRIYDSRQSVLNRIH